MIAKNRGCSTVAHEHPLIGPSHNAADYSFIYSTQLIILDEIQGIEDAMSEWTYVEYVRQTRI